MFKIIPFVSQNLLLSKVINNLHVAKFNLHFSLLTLPYLSVVFSRADIPSFEKYSSFVESRTTQSPGFPFVCPKNQFSVSFTVTFTLNPSAILCGEAYAISLSLTYFTKYSILQVHPCCCKWPYLLFFNDRVIFHYIYMPHLSQLVENLPAMQETWV